ncbi:MAG: hypothetical protein IJY84_05845 [Clostridia bacterium]|nr:hypothetical protein [Clostridia bacterium]
METTKNFKWQLPISIFMLILTVLGMGAIAYFTKLHPLYALLLIPSVFLTVQLTALFHEFGHYLGAVANGFEVYYFSFSCFTVDKFGKKKFIVSLFGEHLGEIRFYPKTERDYAESYAKSLKGGLWGNFLVATVLNAFLVLALFGVFGEASPIISLIFSFAPYSIYALLINLIPWFHPENDGSALFRLKSENERQSVENLFSIQKALFEGKTYADIPKGYFATAGNVSQNFKLPILTYALRRAIELGDETTATAITGVLEGEDFADNEIYCEMLYKFIIDGNTAKIDEYKEVLSFCEEDSLAYLRANLAYMKYLGDEDYVLIAKPTAIKSCERHKACVGDAIYNKKLIEKI